MRLLCVHGTLFHIILRVRFIIFNDSFTHIMVVKGVNPRNLSPGPPKVELRLYEIDSASASGCQLLASKSQFFLDPRSRN